MQSSKSQEQPATNLALVGNNGADNYEEDSDSDSYTSDGETSESDSYASGTDSGFYSSSYVITPNTSVSSSTEFISSNPASPQRSDSKNSINLEIETR